MRKKKKTIGLFDKLLIGGVFLSLIFALSGYLYPLAGSFLKGETTISTAPEKAKKGVKLEELKTFKVASSEMKYLGEIAPTKETKILAGVSGTITELNFELGDELTIGDELLRIEEVRGASDYQNPGIYSDQISQAKIGQKQASESAELAEKTYKNLKSSTESDLKYLKISKKQAERDGEKDKVELIEEQIKSLEKNLSSSLRAAKVQKEIAQLQLKSASVAVKSLEESASPVSPINGVVSEVYVEAGENVSPGQMLLTVADSEKVKIKFFINEEDLSFVKKGQMVEVKNWQGKTLPAMIASISPLAKNGSGKFLVEAEPTSDSSELIPNTTGEIIIAKEKTENDDGYYLIPLSIITVSQNESYLFMLSKEGKAEKVPFSIEEIEGEKALVKINLPPESLIATEGGKFLNEGDAIDR